MSKGGVQGLPDDTYETTLGLRGFVRICGVDEAGRGPLAGPVVAAAVILCGAPPQGLNDSKKLSPKKRALICETLINEHLVAFSVVCNTKIDAINIRQASLEAMRHAIKSLAIRPDYALIDGRDVPPGCPCEAEAVIGGDRRSVSIAAASVVAKQTRDGIMRTLDGFYPQYGFARHMGYGTKQHIESINRHGMLSYHRRSFSFGDPSAKK